MYVEITTPLGALGLEDGGTLPSGTKVEFERTSSLDGRSGPFLQITGEGETAAAKLFQESRFVADVRRLHEVEDGACFRLAWDDDRPALLRSVRETEGTVLSAAAAGDTARFELRFPDQTAGSQFYLAYDDAANPITVRRRDQHQHSRPSVSNGLTTKQSAALSRALEIGYFEVPRRARLVELAAEFDVSDTAMSQRLRRGVSVLVENSRLRS